MWWLNQQNIPCATAGCMSCHADPVFPVPSSPLCVNCTTQSTLPKQRNNCQKRWKTSQVVGTYTYIGKYETAKRRSLRLSLWTTFSNRTTLKSQKSSFSQKNVNEMYWTADCFFAVSVGPTVKVVYDELAESVERLHRAANMMKCCFAFISWLILLFNPYNTITITETSVPVILDLQIIL